MFQDVTAYIYKAKKDSNCIYYREVLRLIDSFQLWTQLMLQATLCEYAIHILER